MNPLIDSLTQDYILLNIEMIRLPVTGSHTRHLLVGLYYAKESKRILEPQEDKILIPVVNNDKGTFAYAGINTLEDFTESSFVEVLKDTIKKTDLDIEDVAFNFNITQSNIQNAYYSFKNKIDDIKELQITHPNFIYDYAMVDWKRRQYITIHLPDTRLDFKYEFGLYPGNLTIYDTHTNRYIFEDHIDSLNAIFNTDYIKSHFYSNDALDLRTYDSGVKDFQRFQYLMLEVLIQEQLRLAGSNNKFEDTFLINDQTAITYYLDKSNSTFSTKLFFNVDDIFSNRTLTLIKHQASSETIVHDISHIDIISTDYEQAEYDIENELFLQQDDEDSTIQYNTNTLFKFMINRLTRYYFNSERTFMEDRPDKKNLIDNIPLITE